MHPTVVGSPPLWRRPCQLYASLSRKTTFSIRRLIRREDGGILHTWPRCSNIHQRLPMILIGADFETRDWMLRRVATPYEPGEKVSRAFQDRVWRNYSGTRATRSSRRVGIWREREDFNPLRYCMAKFATRKTLSNLNIDRSQDRPAQFKCRRCTHQHCSWIEVVKNWSYKRKCSATYRH